MAAANAGFCVKFGRNFTRIRGSISRIYRQENYRSISARAYTATAKDEATNKESGLIWEDQDDPQLLRERNKKLNSQLQNISDTSMAIREDQITKTELLPLLIMPFVTAMGGKYVIHLLQKYTANKTLILVRARALAKELCLELKENGISCKNSITDMDEESSLVDENLVIVACEDDAVMWKDFPVVDLLIQVHQPLKGTEFSLMALKKSNFRGMDAKAVMLYNQNDLLFLTKLQKKVSTSKLSTPSFHIVDSQSRRSMQLANTTSATPALIDRDQPISDLEAPIPAKVPQYAMYRPLVPLPLHIVQRSRLCDQARLYVRGGAGGQGSTTYAGLGGDGGHVILECQEGASLQHFSVRENRRVNGGHGTHYSSLRRKKKGVRGLDLVVPVPPGTTVSTDDGRIIEQLEEVGSRVLVARGGRGGSPSTEDWGGERGEKRVIRLDLKLIADVGLVGFPNAGKSTLLSTISRADPKTGDYPFTTIRPFIGMMEFPDASQISIVDLPGLVEGAHLNRGMGHRFLKHVERTKILALTVDVNGFQLSSGRPERTAFESLCLLLKEMVLYENRLSYKPRLLIVSKMDTDDAQDKYNELLDQMQQLREKGGLLNVLDTIPPDDKLQQITTKDERTNLGSILSMRSIDFDVVIPTSSLSGHGIDNIRDKLKEMV